MASLVVAEHDNAVLKDATHKTVTAAAEVSKPVHVLVAVLHLKTFRRLSYPHPRYQEWTWFPCLALWAWIPCLGILLFQTWFPCLVPDMESMVGKCFCGGDFGDVWRFSRFRVRRNAFPRYGTRPGAGRDCLAVTLTPHPGGKRPSPHLGHLP